MNAKDVNWAEIKSEYLTTEISLERIADKYGISRSTIKRRSSKEGWPEEKKARKAEFVDEVVRNVVENETERIGKKLEGLQETAESLAGLIQVQIQDAWDVREARVAAGGLITDEDTKVLKDLTTALKGVADIIKEVYAIPTIREQIDLEKWEREKQQGSGATEGGIIFLPPVLPPVTEGGGDDGEDDMDTTAETDRISAEA